MIASRHIAPVNYWGLTKQVGPWKTTAVDKSHEALGYDSPHNQIQTVRPYQQDGSKAPTYEQVEIVSPSNIKGVRGPGLRRGKIARAVAGKLEEQRHAEIEDRLAREAKVNMKSQAAQHLKEIESREKLGRDLLKIEDPDTEMKLSKKETIVGLGPLDIPESQRINKLMDIDEEERLSSLSASQAGQTLVETPPTAAPSDTIMVPVLDDITLVERRSNLEELSNLEHAESLSSLGSLGSLGSARSSTTEQSSLGSTRSSSTDSTRRSVRSRLSSIASTVSEAIQVNRKRRASTERITGQKFAKTKHLGAKREAETQRFGGQPIKRPKGN